MLRIHSKRYPILHMKHVGQMWKAKREFGMVKSVVTNAEISE
jgi:hypothetical protein